MADKNGAEMADASRVYTSFVDPLNTQSTVVVGAGIIGCATAYYLASSGNTKPDNIHMVEASPELFASASGKAAGFVAPDCVSRPSSIISSLIASQGLCLRRLRLEHCHFGYTRNWRSSTMEAKTGATVPALALA